MSDTRPYVGSRERSGMPDEELEMLPEPGLDSEMYRVAFW